MMFDSIHTHTQAISGVANRRVRPEARVDWRRGRRGATARARAKEKIEIGVFFPEKRGRDEATRIT
jgi:hypothetical protein